MITHLPDRTQWIAAFARTLRFPLDRFQQEAMEHLIQGHSVLVSAPTGSGKTVVAEFAVFMALQEGRRCIYTTPLKALSNQKYRDLREALPGKVGLMTGDVVIDPDAPVLVMTTEILRNILQADPERVADVSQVILDEAHYLGTEGRGTVWEETIVFLGKGTTVTALSATIPNAEELATWVSTVHRDMRVVFHGERPVPLESFVAAPGLKKLYDDRGRLLVKRFSGEDSWVQSPEPVQVVKELHLKRMLPAIYFIFSRQGCEEQAREVLRADFSLTDPDEHEQIRIMVEDTIRQTPGMLESANTRRWLELLPFGAAPHHAGLLPPLKFLIERLFQKALIKVVFATETLAAGINMPARTVVLASIMKRTDEGHRTLTVGEFHQMMGRAGRRGMDPVGYGVVVASHRYSALEVANLVRGAVEPLKSRFTLNYNMVANLHHRYEREHARRIVEQSFAQFQSTGAIAALFEQRRLAEERQGALDPRCPLLPERDRSELLEGLKLLRGNRESLRKRLSALEGDRQYLSRNSALRQLSLAREGAWVLVHPPGMPGPQLGVLLDVQKLKSGDAHFSVLLETPSIQRLGTQHLVMVLPAEPVSSLPRELLDKARQISFLQSHSPGSEKPAWEEWIRLSGLDLEGLVKPVTDPPEVARARARHLEVARELERHACTSCKQRKACQEQVRERRVLLQEIKRTSTELEAIQSSHWRGFLRLVEVLEEAGYVRGRELLARGTTLANLRTTNELMSAEALASGWLEGLSAFELAGAASALVAEPVRGRQAWRPLPFSPQLGMVFERWIKEGKRLARIQERHAVELPITLVADYVGLTQAWAEGQHWAPLIEASGIDEGQLVRHLRQVIDLLQQFREIPGAPEIFREQAAAAIALLDRDLVREVF